MAWNQPDRPQGQPSRRGRGNAAGAGAWLRELQRRLGIAGAGPGSGGDGGGPAAPDARRVATVVGVVLLAFLAYDSSYMVDSSEIAVVQRFGRFTRLSGPGWHLRLPRPIESITKVNVARVNSYSYQSSMLTSDVNLVNISAEVQYLYADAQRMLFRVRDPEATLHEVAESAIREVIGQNPLEDVLAGEPRQAITVKTRDLIQKTLDSYDAGISVNKVNLTDVQVPEDVQAAQRDANKAIEDKERLSKEAQAYANDIIPKARGNAQRLLLDAEAYKLQVVATADGESSRFAQVLTAYTQAPEVTRNRLYTETMEAVLARSTKVLVDAKAGGGGNMIYLPLDKLGAGSGRTATVTAEPIQDVAPVSSATESNTNARARDRADR